jgi:hypothetical protein
LPHICSPMVLLRSSRTHLCSSIGVVVTPCTYSYMLMTSCSLHPLQTSAQNHHHSSAWVHHKGFGPPSIYGDCRRASLQWPLPLVKAHILLSAYIYATVLEGAIISHKQSRSRLGFPRFFFQLPAAVAVSFAAVAVFLRRRRGPPSIFLSPTGSSAPPSSRSAAVLADPGCCPSAIADLAHSWPQLCLSRAVPSRCSSAVADLVSIRVRPRGFGLLSVRRRGSCSFLAAGVPQPRADLPQPLSVAPAAPGRAAAGGSVRRCPPCLLRQDAPASAAPGSVFHLRPALYSIPTSAAPGCRPRPLSPAVLRPAAVLSRRPRQCCDRLSSACCTPQTVCGSESASSSPAP